MNKYIETNTRLAELLGWKNIFDAGGTLVGTPVSGAPGSRGQAVVPDWCGDWAACGPLMVKQDPATLQVTCNAVVLLARNPWALREHADLDAATRYAIVSAVINKLENSEEKEMYK